MGWSRTVEGAHRRAIGHAVTIGSIVVIGLLTLKPYAGPIARFAWCLECGELNARDIILNFLLFIPLGVGLALEGHRFWRSFVLIALTTLIIETLQATVIPGRSSTLSDLLTNSAGGVAGYWLARQSPAWMLPAPTHSRRLLFAYLAFLLLLQATVSCAALRLRGAHEYWGQWTHVWRSTVPFRGTLQSFVVNGTRVPDDRGAPLAGSIAPLLLGDSIQLSIDVTPGPPVERLAAIASVSNETRGNILLLGQLGRDLIVRERMLGSRIGLQTPAFRFADAFAGTAEAAEGNGVSDSASSRRVEVSFTDRQIVINLSRGSNRLTRVIAITPALAWAFLEPLGGPIGRSAILFNLCWVLVQFVPLGYWLAWTTQRESARRAAVSRLAPYAIALTSAVMGLEVIPAFVGISPSSASEWLGAILGSFAGVVIARSIGLGLPRHTLHVDQSGTDKQGDVAG